MGFQAKTAKADEPGILALILPGIYRFLFIEKFQFLIKLILKPKLTS